MEIKSLTITNNKILQIRVPKADRAKQQNTQRIFFANQDDWYLLGFLLFQTSCYHGSTQHSTASKRVSCYIRWWETRDSCAWNTPQVELHVSLMCL